MKIVLTVLMVVALVWGAARAQIAFRNEQYSVTASYPTLLVPNCPDALYAATSAFVQLEYVKSNSSVPLGMRLEPTAYRVTYNAQYALGFALEMELSVIVTSSGVQLKQAFSSSSVPNDVVTQALRDYANRVFKGQLEWIAATVQAEPCRYTAPSVAQTVNSTTATLSVAAKPATALILDERIKLTRPIEPLETASGCERAYGGLARPTSLPTTALLASSGCVLVRGMKADQFQLELYAQMRAAGFRLLSAQVTDSEISNLVKVHSEVWGSNEGLVWLRYGSGSNTTMLWQQFATK